MRPLFNIRRTILLLILVCPVTLVLPLQAQENVTQDSIAQNTVSQNNISQNNISQNKASQKNVSQENAEQENTQVMQAFTSQDQGDVMSIEDKTKQLVMFVMGVPLLVLLLVTGGLGIAMGVYGKQVFVAHMICAGLSMTLAIAHAIVGLVWFYPF